jgi:tetratricopeptide (TPR) repeat protein
MDYTLRRALLAVMVAASTVVIAASPEDLHEAQRLYGQGKLPAALEKIDAYLVAQPRDAQGRFLRGLVLTDQKRTAEAIQVFTALTEDFPELAEPYNNLAVLYAAQGNYERARAVLELAIQTHPAYALAQENLGDIYAQLAARAYDRALQLDRANTSAGAKAAKAKELIAPQRTTP